MNDLLILPDHYQRPYTLQQMRQARDQALAKLKASYDEQRRQILHDYKVTMENGGYAPARKDAK